MNITVKQNCQFSHISSLVLVAQIYFDFALLPLYWVNSVCQGQSHISGALAAFTCDILSDITTFQN